MTYLSYLTPSDFYGKRFFLICKKIHLFVVVCLWTVCEGSVFLDYRNLIADLPTVSLLKLSLKEYAL